MRLCSDTNLARELLQDGKLNLSNAAQLQNLFERSDRSRGRPPGSAGIAGSLSGGPRNGCAPGSPAPAAPTHAGGSDSAPAAGPVLDAAAREELVRQAAGKSTREVQQMLAEVDPELARPSAARLGAGAAWALGRHHVTEHACGQPNGMRGSGQAASPVQRHGQTDGNGREAGVDGRLDRATCAAGLRFVADRRTASRAPVRGGRRFPTSPAKRLANAAGRGAVGPAVRSPALERHLATLSGFGAAPGSRSRYIPAAVRREVWRRDQGCCSYVDRHSGRRCGSRYRLEVDHIVPFALGGGAEPGDLRLLCEAHHRLRHMSTERVPNEARRGPMFAVDSKERARTVGSHAAIDRVRA